MRVLFCKIQCPFMCFYKASAAHLYTSEPLKLENTPNHIVPSTAYAVPDVSDHHSRLVYGDVSDNSSSGVEEEGENGNLEAENVLKSCIKKLPTEEVRKKRVQWKDKLGKELAEIKEFESSETGDTDNEEENSRCLCVIL